MWGELCGWENIQKGAATIFADLRMNVNNSFESYAPMSSKTQNKQRGKIQPLKTVELSEFQLWSNLHVRSPGLSAPKRMLLKDLHYNSWLHSFLSPRVNIYITSENPLREIGVFQNGSAWTRSDADATHLRKASGVIQMRQTRQMQINTDAWIRNWTDDFDQVRAMIEFAQ